MEFEPAAPPSEGVAVDDAYVKSSVSAAAGSVVVCAAKYSSEVDVLLAVTVDASDSDEWSGWPLRVRGSGVDARAAPLRA